MCRTTYIRNFKKQFKTENKNGFKKISAQDPDPQKYADPRNRIQGAKYQPKTAKKNLLYKPKTELLKKERF